VHSPRKEVGGYNVELTEDGLKDPLFQGFQSKFPVFQWHNDMFQVPKDGKLLATGDLCPIQAFKVGNVRGVIFHLEITSNEAKKWAEAYPDELISVGKTKQEVIEECQRSEDEMKKLSEKFITNFIGMIK
jgi:GMP synthase-like glutamine amidotransferase